MQENVDINVKLTLKDIRDFCFAMAYKRVVSKILLALAGLYTFFMLICLGALIISSLMHMDLGFYDIVPLMVMPVVIFSSIILLPFFANYTTQKNNFRKSKLLGNMQYCELSDKEIKISSCNGSVAMGWSDVYKVEELKPCFLIFSSPGKVFIIPRRCFENQIQLDMFLYIMASNLDNQKLKLKKYKLGKVSPDYGQIIKFNEEQLSSESNLEPLAEVSFLLDRREVIDMNFKTYYTSPSGVIISGIGVLLLLSYIRDLIIYKSSSEMILLPGLIFSLGMPFLLYFNTSKRFKNDAVLKSNYVYKFYRDFFTVSHSSGSSRIKWDDLVKIKETKSAYLFFITKQIAHIIPKRTFEDKKDGLEALKKVVLDNYLKR